jgi:hypothetical protein
MKRHSLMLTNLLLSLPVAAGLLCAAPSASAQNSASSSGTAIIPFSFSAGHQQEPAGRYEVQRLSFFLVALRNVETEKTEILTVNPEGGSIVVETQGTMVFHRDGTKYFLTQVKFGGSSFRSLLTAQPKLEQATAKKAVPSDPTIEVAMK